MEKYEKRKFWKIIATFFKFVTKEKRFYALFLFLLLTSYVAKAVTPYFYKLFIDNLPKLDFNKLLLILIYYSIVRVSSLIFSMIGDYIGDFFVIPDSATRARTAVFKHLQDLDFAFHSSKSTGSLISIIKRGDSAFWTLYHNFHFSILDTTISFLVMTFFFIRLEPLIALIIFVSFVATLFISKSLIAKNIQTRSDFNSEEDNISGILVDNIINFDTVKFFSKENWEYEKLLKHFVVWKHKFKKFGMSFRYIDAGVGSVIEISIFTTLLLGLTRVVQAKMTLGEFTLIIGFILTFYPQLWSLIWNIRDIAKNFTDIEKYFGILDQEIKIKDPENPVLLNRVLGDIDFKKVTFEYAPKTPVVISGVELNIRQGQSVALVGRSGSGKTTLIKLLLRYYDVTHGKITIDGVNIKDLTKNNLRSFIGVVPQEPILFNRSIKYNIGYGKSNAIEKEIIAAAKLANIHGFIDSLPQGYDTEVGERGLKLSGGQKQRIAIARMILYDPAIIVFDEATSQLDSENEKLIQEALAKLIRDKTTIIIAHRLSTAARADKIVVMDKGKIVEEGSHKYLYDNRDSLYRYFWNLQTASHQNVLK